MLLTVISERNILKCSLDLLINSYMLAFKLEMYEQNDNQLKSDMRSVKM